MSCDGLGLWKCLPEALDLAALPVILVNVLTHRQMRKRLRFMECATLQLNHYNEQFRAMGFEEQSDGG